MNIRTKRFAVVFLAALVCCVFVAVEAGAEEMLQNGSFENYDPVTLVPDNWQVLDGNVEIYHDQVHDGAVSVYSLGGTMIEGVDTPNPPQSGTMVQLIDLSAMPGWDTINWFSVRFNMEYRLWGVNEVRVCLEYLPASYNTIEVTADDPAWNSGHAQATLTTYGRLHARSDTPWFSKGNAWEEIPRVRWARLRFVFESAYKSNRYFEDGPYYVAIDSISLDLEAVTPEPPCTGNLLVNPGFEDVSGATPTGWHVLSGRMSAISFGSEAPYSGDWYAGNIGGYITPNPDPEEDPTDHPDPPQNGSLVQVIDLSNLTNWDDTDFITFNFGGHYIWGVINGLSVRLEYLPESYNETTVTWNDPAWDNDAETAVNMVFNKMGPKWEKFETDQGTMPKVRWVRVRLNVDDSSLTFFYNYDQGEYLGGFDQISFQAEPVQADALIKNQGFEDYDENNLPLEWHQDPEGTVLSSWFEPPPAFDGDFSLGNHYDSDKPIGRVYQVIDLADKIFGWIAINPNGGSIELPFIEFNLSAHVFNIGGTRVKVSMEYLPYSYNSVNGITWDDPAWQPSQWSSDGTDFTNAGGDAIDVGTVIEDTTVDLDTVWREKNYAGWLPKVRWLRLQIELDATPNGGFWPIVGLDALNLSAACKLYGPYSCFGYLPEATFPESPDAPDKPIPAWVGPEGDGISGGYTGQTKRNYVNPTFAGFADSCIHFSPSGQNLGNWDDYAENITGRPYTDAGWGNQIISLGDMDADMLADYFGPAPSGDYHPGEITAGFDECPIANGEGPDFATFENGFSAGWTSSMIFGELAYVEVSSNGIDFIRFPSHSLTPKWPGAYGCFIAQGVFGLTGKHINAYGDQWGTPFDLEWLADHPLVLNGTVDLNDIRYVRQVDIPGGGPGDAQGGLGGLFHDSYGNPIFDAWPTWGSGGADLDAVAVLNSSATDSDGDHIVDYWDNCPETKNPKQFDRDNDGYGNMCDCDIDGDEGGDGIVNVADYTVFRAAYGGHGPERIPGEPGQPDTYTDPSENWNPDADFNGDNVVNAADFAIFRSRYGSMTPFE